jgi:glucosamine--fructose-6-phosphate aminotransferase (isomerizing)
MCGIVGYVGPRDAVEVLVSSLERLEYRGYDSAGVAVCRDGRVEVRKGAGRISHLRELLRRSPLGRSSLGIGHTRWATHGRPSDENAHPHTDREGCIAVVHNGIIENFSSLRRWLEERGHEFFTETDTEVIPHLIGEFYQGNLEAAVREAARRLEGAYALAIISAREPDRLVVLRRASPLVVGLGEGENFVASDIPAVLPYTRRFLVLEEGEMAVLTPQGVRLSDLEGREKPLEGRVREVDWDPQQAERGGYPHFMLKEIYEQPRALLDTLRGRVDWASRRVSLTGEHGVAEGFLQGVRKVAFVACGTAYHASLLGAYWVQRLARLPAEAHLASEFRYADPLLDPHTLVVAVSQSGETADTLAAAREARSRGGRLLAVTNVVGSSLSREAEGVLYTWAGPEVAVASTKAYLTQLVLLFLLALHLGREEGKLAEEEEAALVGEVARLPERAERFLPLADEEATRAAEVVASRENAFFIGRGPDYALAMEGQLKLKEISYIHAEAYPAGELKHGALALVTDGFPVVALATQPHLQEKMLSNIMEVRARGGKVLVLSPPWPEAEPYADFFLSLPPIHPHLRPLLAVIPLQLLAYRAACLRGTDVDKPRNLAKSVTVE